MEVAEREKKEVMREDRVDIGKMGEWSRLQSSVLWWRLCTGKEVVQVTLTGRYGPMEEVHHIYIVTEDYFAMRGCNNERHCWCGKEGPG